MECECIDVETCEGISHPVFKKKIKDVQKISKVIDKIEPLFTLPPELMKCNRCKRKKKRLEKFYKQIYTRKRLNIENFRRSVNYSFVNFLLISSQREMLQ